MQKTEVIKQPSRKKDQLILQPVEEYLSFKVSPAMFTLESDPEKVAGGLRSLSLTCLKVSHDLKLLLTGDSLGNIHVYSLFGGPNVSEELLSIIAHESDISALDICP